MKSRLQIIACSLMAAATVTTLILITGCAGTPLPPTKSGFLSNYANLQQINDTTWRYIFTNRLALYNKFELRPVTIVATEFEGKPITEEQKAKAVAYIRDSLTKALGAQGYAVVTSGGPDVGQIRIAITQVYKSREQVGLTVEGEVLDASSGYQAAAVMKTELGDIYLGSWWDAPSAKHIVDHWSDQMAYAIKLAHGQ